MSGQSCPACGTAWLPDLRPACDCALRARAAESAQAPPDSGERAEQAPGGGDHVFGVVAPPDAPQPGVSDADLELFDEPSTGSSTGPGAGASGQPLPDEAPAVTAAFPRPAGAHAGDPPDFGPEELRRSGPDGAGRGLRYGLLAGVTAVALAAVGITSGFFGGEPAGDAQARPDGGAVSVSDAESTPATHKESPSRAGRGSERPSHTPSGTPTHSASPSTSASASSSAEPSASSSSAPSPSRTTSPSASGSPESSEPPATASGTLRRGDRGEAVEELQLRLQQLQLYVGPAHGNYNAEVESAVERFQQARQIPEEPGVYGPQTRAAVETETSEPD